MPTPASFYRQVDVHLHGDEKIRALTPEPPSGRGLFKHLLLCPELGPLPGVIRSGAAAMAEALEWPVESLREHFGELVREGLAQADWKARLIFVANGIRYNGPDNPNQVIGWTRHWNALPDSPLKSVIWERYLDHFKSDADRRRKEIDGGTRDKRQDPEALLKAFLEHIAKPGAAAALRFRPSAGSLRRPARRARGSAASAKIASSAPPSPLPRKPWAAAPIAGEDLLDPLAQELQAAHPHGLAGGIDLQHALLQALKTGELRADGTAAKSGIHSITLSDLRERHAAWCAAWAAGASLPMNLANWIGKRRCWREQPPEVRIGRAAPAEISRRRERSAQSGADQSLQEAVRLEEEARRTLKWGTSA